MIIICEPTYILFSNKKIKIKSRPLWIYFKGIKISCIFYSKTVHTRAGNGEHVKLRPRKNWHPTYSGPGFLTRIGT